MNSLLTEYSIMRGLGEIDQLLNLPDDEAQKETPRKIASLLKRMEALFSQMGEILDDSVSFRAPTSLKRIRTDLQQLKDVLTLYLYKSRLFKIVHCKDLNELLMAMVNKFEDSLGAVARGLPQDSELCKGFNDLASEMKGTQLKVGDMEELICRSIDEELNKDENDSSVNDALIMNLSRELRMANRYDLNQFFSEIDLYRSDTENSSCARDSDIVQVLEKLFRNQSIEPHEAATLQRAAASDEFEELPIPPFRTFLCPLSGEVMRNPVGLVETGQTYERQEIEKWFKCCAEEGRQPRCPMTGQALRSTTWRKNVDLQNTIEEWHDRNVSIVITRTKDRLSLSSSPQEFEKAVDELLRISEESMHYRNILRNAGIIPLLLGPWDRPLENDHSVRRKVLDTLRSMASQNKENKLEMADKNVIRLAVKSLTSNQEQEKESAALLLCELSLQSEVCAKIVQQKGAILLLSGFISSGGNAYLSNLANEIMRNMQGDQSNVITMAQAGHLEPLLECLTNGSSDVKLQMVSHLSHMTLSNNDKEMVIEKAGPSLIEVLSCDNTDKDVVLKTLLMLSSPANNAPVLINLGCLPPLFSVLSSDNPNAQLKEKAAEIFVNLLSKAGHWESYPIASDGTTLQSELAIHCFLRLLNRINLQWKSNLLRILFYIAASPQAAGNSKWE